MKSTLLKYAAGAGAVVALALFSVGASAQAPCGGPGGAGGPGMGPMHGMHGPMHGGRMGGFAPERVNAHLQALEAALKLQPAQKPAFDALAAKVRSEAQARQGYREGMQKLAGDQQAMLDYRITIAKHRVQALEEVSQLRKQLVAALTPEQVQALNRFGPGARGPMAGPMRGSMQGPRGPMGGRMMGGPGAL